jgi:hypothetical protein
MRTTALRWAEEEFGTTNLRDVRRTRRLVAMAAGVAARPSGKVSSVFDRQKEREGAYDFLENDAVDVASLANSVFAATVRRAQGEPFVYVAIDGSSLSLTDDLGSKGFGPVGSPNTPVKGLMEMGALAVTRKGVPLGLVDQAFWVREPTELMTSAERTKRNQARSFEQKEPHRFVVAAKNAHERLAAVGTKAWVLIDREGDSRDILLALHQTGCCFTVRAKWNRRVRDEIEPNVQGVLDSAPALGAFEIEVPRNGKRAARTATLEVRAAQVVLHFKSNGRPQEALRLFAVRVRERGEHDNALDWLLYTNVPVLTAEHAQQIIDGYRARWRIEEFHRTWKQGDCNVEDAQLRSFDAVVRWATVLAAVATRIERLKYLSRVTPDEPATIELVDEEIEALKLDQRRRGATKKKRLPKMPTIGEATRWIAELGGWIGLRNGPPGSVTISRGLERLGYLVEGIALARGRSGLPT